MVSTRQSSSSSSGAAASSASSSAVDTYGTGSHNHSGSGSAAGSSSTLHVNYNSKLLRSGPIPATPPHQVDMTVAVIARPPRHLLELPQEVCEKILSFLDYKGIAHLRQVCRQMDKICQGMLNTAFQRLQAQMLHRFQAIKAKMPRRESARRNHPLACESDIIETLHMRLTLLQMTFGKHIERKHCCFFAGEILDEVNRILHYIKVTNKLARPYKVTDELFDLTTMAMEFFKENIEPTLPEIAYFGTDFIELTFNASSPSSKYFSLDSPPHGSKEYESPASGNEALAIEPPPQRQTNMVLRKRIRKIKQGMKRYNSQLSVMRRDLRTSKSKMSEQQKQLMEYSSRLDEYDKKNEETARKFSTLLQELNKCKTELQYWRSRIPAFQPMCNNCGHVTMAPTPTPSEDHHIPDPGVLGLNVDNNLPLEGIEFPAEASTSHDVDPWKFYEEKATMPADKPQEKSAGPSKPATKGKGMKRRATEEDQVDSGPKKPKRCLKVRSGSKRVKT